MSAPAAGKSAKRLAARDFRGPTSSGFGLIAPVRRPEMSAPAAGKNAKRLSVRDLRAPTSSTWQCGGPK